MVCIIVLLATNILNSTEQTNITAEKEASEQVADAQDEQNEKETSEQIDNTQDEQFKNGYVTVKGEKHPLYVWDEELADEPITPTKVEETWILDGMNDGDHPELSKQIEDLILEHAENYECYGNPTVVNCLVYPQNIYACEAVMVDFRTKEHNMETYVYAPSENIIHCAAWTMDLDKIKPYINEDGKYIFNANNLYTYNAVEKLGYTNDELEIMQKKTMEALKNKMIESEIYDKYYEKINHFVLSSMEIEDRDNITIRLYTTLSNGKNYNFSIHCPFDADEYYCKY